MIILLASEADDDVGDFDAGQGGSVDGDDLLFHKLNGASKIFEIQKNTPTF